MTDATIVNVALPTIGREFHVSPTAVDSIAISFLVSLAVFIPASGWLGDRFGGKRVLLIAIVVFTGASALCGIATDVARTQCRLRHDNVVPLLLPAHNARNLRQDGR